MMTFAEASSLYTGECQTSRHEAEYVDVRCIENQSIVFGS